MRDSDSLLRPVSPRRVRTPPLQPEDPFMVVVDVGAAVVTAGLLLVVGLGLTGPVRVLLALSFVTFVPGWAILDWIRLAEGISRVALAVALSLAICSAAALMLLWLRRWEPFLLLYVTGAVSLIAVVWHLARKDHLSGVSPTESRVSAGRGVR